MHSTRAMSPELTEADLVGRARSGDARAYEQLVVQHQRLVFRILWARGARPDEVEDLAQETFIRGWQRLHTFDPAQPFKPWIARVAENLVVDHHRARARRPASAPMPEGEAAELKAGPPTDPEAVTIGHETQRGLLAALQALPDRYREVLVLRFVEDLPYDEIADLLGLPLGSVKTRIFRGRELLKQRLALSETGV